MTLDTSTPFRKPSELVQLVRHILDGDLPSETDWCEWKGPVYDLEQQTPRRAQVARHLIGFGNRDPDRAAQMVEGDAYLLLGVERDALHGVPAWELANVEDWVRVYAGDTLRWRPFPVELEGTTVLTFTVEAPRLGDPIYILRKDSTDEAGKTMRAGTVFVRRGARTEQASAADHDRLQARLVKGTGEAKPLSLKVMNDPAHLPVFPAHLLSNEHRERFMESEREDLLSRLPAPRKDPYGSVIQSITAPTTDHRKRDQYVAEVENYVARLRDGDTWTGRLFAWGVERQHGGRCLLLVNETERNYESVRLELTLPVGVYAFFDAEEPIKEFNVPKRPSPWGTIVPLPRVTPLVEPYGERDEVWIVEGKGMHVQCKPIHLRPKTPEEVSPIYFMVLPEAVSDGHVNVRWKATAKNVEGVARGDLRISVEAPAVESDGAAPAAAAS